MQGTRNRPATPDAAGVLLTSAQVGAALGIDQSTVYRMAADGRLRAVKVGRQWRFPAGTVDDLLGMTANATLTTDQAPTPAPPASWLGPTPAAATPAAHPMSLVPTRPAPIGTATDASSDAAGTSAPDGLDTAAALAAVAVAAELLGVMMVVTDMSGHPLTPVANPCPRFADVADEPSAVAACAAEWRALADELDLQPRFRPGALGFECARSYVRSGDRLVAMVLAGGLAPCGDDDPDLYHLDPEARDAVLAALPRVAAALSRVGVRTP